MCLYMKKKRMVKCTYYSSPESKGDEKRKNYVVKCLNFMTAKLYGTRKVKIV